MASTRGRAAAPRLAGLAIAAVLVCTGLSDATAAPASRHTGQRRVAGAINRSDRGAVRGAYLTRLLPAAATAVGWTGNASPSVCRLGTESVASRQATLAAVNYYRAMVGLEAVTLDPTWTTKSLQAALMMDAADALSHDPAGQWMGQGQWPCSTVGGTEAAARSNLFWSTSGSGARSVPEYIIDRGPTNAPVGHRRWLLSPDISRIGTGSTTQANAMWVVPPTTEPSDGPDWVAWPPSGYVPTPLLVGQKPGGPQTSLGRWSLSTRSTVGARFATARVTATLNGSPLAVTIESRPDGASALVWSLHRRDGSAFPIAEHMTVVVTVSGIVVGGTVRSRTWTVRLFPVFPPVAPAVKAVTASGRTATATWSPSTTQGVAVRGYRMSVYRASRNPADSPFGGTPVARVAVGRDARGATVSGLPRGRWYWVVVTARSAAGDSSYGTAQLRSVWIP